MVVIDGNTLIELEGRLDTKLDKALGSLDNTIKGLQDKLEVIEGQLTKLQEKSVTSSTSVKSRQAF